MDMDLSAWDPRLEDAETHLEQGIEIGFAEGEAWDSFLRAERLLTEMLESEPCHARALRLRARARFCLSVEAERRGEDPLPFLWQAAEDQLRVPEDPDSTQFLLERAWTFLRCVVPLSHRGEDILPWVQRARGCVEQMLRRCPSDPEALRVRAELTLALGDVAADRGEDPASLYDGALEEFQAAGLAGGDVDDDIGRVELRQGEAFKRKGLDPAPAYCRALQSFERASRNLGTAASAQHAGETLLALAEGLEGKAAQSAIRRAFRWFDLAVRISPDSIDALLGRSRALMERAEGRGARDSLSLLESALGDLDRARSLTPASSDVHAVAGHVAYLKLCALLELEPEATSRLRDAGRVAMEALNQAVALDPENRTARALRAQLRLRLWSHGSLTVEPPDVLLDGLLRDANELIRSGKASPEAWNWRAAARLFRALGETDPGRRRSVLLVAQADVETALLLVPAHSASWDLKAKILLHQSLAEAELGMPARETIRSALHANTRSGGKALDPERVAVLRELAGEAR